MKLQLHDIKVDGLEFDGEPGDYGAIDEILKANNVKVDGYSEVFIEGSVVITRHQDENYDGLLKVVNANIVVFNGSSGHTIPLDLKSLDLDQIEESVGREFDWLSYEDNLESRHADQQLDSFFAEEQ